MQILELGWGVGGEKTLNKADSKQPAEPEMLRATDMDPKLGKWRTPHLWPLLIANPMTAVALDMSAAHRK